MLIFEPFEPGVQGSSQLRLAASGPQGLGLEVEADQARPAAIDGDSGASLRRSVAGLHHERDVVGICHTSSSGNLLWGRALWAQPE
jgi:hypothetical protein